MKNESIMCNVNECKYHYKQEDYCTLDKIDVIKHENNAHSVKCTDCGSFEKENQ
ncbi:MAG: DUF1540 domain-containing protein [Clostridium argentinense]|uniref:DUF1540 domain-containing protein n=1 Tax=Clostridium faecium TaxID=2762223 RepID=A0ABR8YTC5_9CLOT|nr:MULTISPECIES: DUF1540 domain-containing protein [Clostridium]MBD8047397.1 DUF1540 domain-containing protein [Clostridium faecium]MBS5822995.1 DUF1540 domain-containing protein [Clostridium argentinense]MDU1349785.1 DUF1540 domain-containing protein [Clostridium argentinense]